MSTLTRDRIVAAAIDLIEREGVDAISMRRIADGLGVRWHEPQPGTAGKRFPQAHAAPHTERLGCGGDLPHHLLAPGLGRHRGGLREKRPAISQRGQELEAGIQDRHHHSEHMFA